MAITDEQLGQLLLKTHLLDEKQLVELIEFAKNSHGSLSETLIEKDIISDENLGILIADYIKCPFIVLSKISIPQNVFHIIPERLARVEKIVPFARDNRGISVAMVDPFNTQLLELIARKTNQNIIPHLATERDVYNALKIFRKDMQKAVDTLLKDVLGPTGKTISADAPITKIVDIIISYAYQDRASDIHIEPEEKDSLIRFRLDGILHDVLFLPKVLHDQVITRIKVLSRLRTDEHLAPQDGKMRMSLAEEDLDIRVSILPIADGEKAVLRLLASKFRQISLIELGMNEADLKKVTAAFSKSFGMILSTGPTGSGKTTSIYAILKILNVREKNITTIEDPIEYHIRGVNQIQVNTKTNLTFASGLRSILRQDPNIVFVGEIRDAETAGIAVNAALTGHLVLSTLHTNDASTALPRLIDMRVEPFLVASTVNVIIGQRLIRKICDMCKVSLQINKSSLIQQLPEAIIVKHFGPKEDILIYKGAGCKVCHGTGYTGRVGLFEVLVISKTLRELIIKKEDADVIQRQAILEGMSTMLDDGLEKIVKGITTLEEVLRVTKVESL